MGKLDHFSGALNVCELWIFSFTEALASSRIIKNQIIITGIKREGRQVTESIGYRVTSETS